MTSNPLPVTVRTERDADVPFVTFVVDAAFGKPRDSAIVNGVRGTDDWWPSGSIVAEDASGRIVGHVLLSRGRLVGADGSVTHIGMIGPVAVLPEVQGLGIGGELVRAAVAEADEMGLPVVCLLGHPTYYPRFGFTPARAMGIEPSDPGWPDAAWMAIRLRGWSPDLRGTAYFAPAFDAE
jgi:putative acetyltransferase